MIHSYNREILLEIDSDRHNYLNDVMNYLTFTSYSKELEKISFELASILETNEGRMSGQFKLKILIILGRFYYEKEQLEDSKATFKKVSIYK